MSNRWFDYSRLKYTMNLKNILPVLILISDEIIVLQIILLN